MPKDRDIHGRPYARVKEVKAADSLWPDGGFSCLTEGSRLTVQARSDGSLFVPCAIGEHSLDGQIAGRNGCEYYVGLYPSAPEGGAA